MNMHCSENFRLFYITRYFVSLLLLEIDIFAAYNLQWEYTLSEREAL